MFWKKLKSIFTNTCPRCTRGPVFQSKNPYKVVFSQSGDTFENCSHCGLKYEREVGFWYGAMYVSYGLGVALFVAMWLATYVLLPEDLSIGSIIAIVITPMIVFFPVTYYLARLIWVNIFIKYRPEYDVDQVANKSFK